MSRTKFILETDVVMIHNINILKSNSIVDHSRGAVS